MFSSDTDEWKFNLGIEFLDLSVFHKYWESSNRTDQGKTEMWKPIKRKENRVEHNAQLTMYIEYVLFTEYIT